MENRVAWSAGLAAVSGLLLLRLFGPPAQETGARDRKAEPRKSAPAEKAKPETESTEPVPYEGPWLASRSFFRQVEQPAVPSNAGHEINLASPQSINECAVQAACANALAAFLGISGQVRFLIATVPDPRHSRLALLTDSGIQALLKGVTASGWEFANQWLPWEDTVDPEEKDPDDRRKQRSHIREQERQPGLLAFRCSVCEDNRPLLVFVVGETPTAGINAAQFRLAMSWVRAVRGTQKRASSDEPVRILGPTFSGSFASLGGLIVDERQVEARKPSPKAPFRFQVRSGTATSKPAEDAFRKETCSHNQNAADGCVEFESANADSEQQAEALVEFLSRFGVPAEKTALIVEDESAYGNSVAPKQARDKDQKPNRISEFRARAHVYRFPRDMSHLRNAYRDIVNGSGNQSAAAPDVEFSLKDPDIGEDSVPTFSPLQSPLEDNAIVNDIATQIRRDGILVAQISATNVLDLLFLAQLLRRQCPDTRILVSYPDLLFNEASRSMALTGLLAFSSYPLFPRANEWLGTQFDDSSPFISSNAWGVFDSVQRLLGKPQQLPQAIWLLKLDRTGFAPVDVHWLSHAAVMPPTLHTPSGTWDLAAFVLSGLGLAVLVWMLLLNFVKSWIADGRLMPGRSGQESGWRLFFLILLLGSLASMIAVLCLPVWLDGVADDLAERFGMVACALISATGVVLLVTRLPQWDRVTAASAASLAVVVAGFISWYNLCRQGAERGFFFEFRAIELHPGSSPTLPVLGALGALLAFAFVHLTRHYLAANQTPEVMTENFQSALQQRMHNSYLSFTRRLATGFGVVCGSRPGGPDETKLPSGDTFKKKNLRGRLF